MKKFILYIPFFNFTKYHLFKDPGGILRGFRDLGYKSSIISGKFDVNAADMLNGIKCYETGLTYIKKPILDNAKEIIHVLKLLIKEKPDIFLFYNHSNMVVLVLIPLYRLSVIFFNLHTKIYMKMDSDGSSFKKANFVKKPFLYLLNLFLGIFIDRVIIENSCGYKVYKSIFTYNKKLKIIPNGVSDELLYNAAKFKRRPNIISVSRITPSKGIDILIKAYSNIALKFPDWKLLLVGPVEDKKIL